MYIYLYFLEENRETKWKVSHCTRSQSRNFCLQLSVFQPAAGTEFILNHRNRTYRRMNRTFMYIWKILHSYKCIYSY